jgi:hypothetical protein
MLIAHKAELDGKGLAIAADVQEMGGHSTHEMMDTSVPVEIGVRVSYPASELESSYSSHQSDTSGELEGDVRSRGAT